MPMSQQWAWALLQPTQGSSTSHSTQAASYNDPTYTAAVNESSPGHDMFQHYPMSQYLYPHQSQNVAPPLSPPALHLSTIDAQQTEKAGEDTEAPVAPT